MVKITKVCSGSGGILRDMVGVISSPRQVKKSLNLALNVTCKISSPLQEKISETDFPKYPLDLLMLQPQQYPHGMDCRWVIVAPPGHIIKLTWMSFNLEESHTCSYDYLAVFDNTTIPGTGRLSECILLTPSKLFGHLHQLSCNASIELKVVLWVSTVATATRQT